MRSSKHFMIEACMYYTCDSDKTPEEIYDTLIEMSESDDSIEASSRVTVYAPFEYYTVESLLLEIHHLGENMEKIYKEGIEYGKTHK